MSKKINTRLRLIGLSILFLLIGLVSYAQEPAIPAKPSPPRLVNDLAHMMTEGEADQLESELNDFNKQTSNEITIVTIDSLGDYDVSDYAIKLGKAWGVGKSGKNNGVVILASLKDHKINISSGKGLEGALTDLQCGQIIRNEMVPSFKDKNYYEGFSKAASAVIAVTKGEYKADPSSQEAGHHVPITAIIILLIIIVFVIRIIGGGGGGGGNYMSGSGLGNFATGMFLGSMFGGGRGGDGGGFGGGGGGGFGGFGGGDFGGGGASGSW